MSKERKHGRRVALKVLATGTAAAAAGWLATGGSARGAGMALTQTSWFRGFFQTHYRQMTQDEVGEMLARLEASYRERYGREVAVTDTPAEDGVLFGYALHVGRCKGYRDCVHACVEENNLPREPDQHYIRVLELERGSLSMASADHYFDPPTVPEPGKVYLPVQCFQCDNPPCVDACPVDATWKEKDGIVVVDYERCIGCRYCATACPYWARRFNWREPELSPDEINPDTHVLGNRPRPVGVIEKCTFCIQRVRDGRQPACQEACPTGARVFGNLLDPDSEIRWVLANKTVFRLKEELGTEPKFWYFTD